MWSVGICGEEDRESGDEEEREHCGYEDPVREEAPETGTDETKTSSPAAASSDGDRHWSSASDIWKARIPIIISENGEEKVSISVKQRFSLERVSVKHKNNKTGKCL